jgi:hypothetical protein
LCLLGKYSTTWATATVLFGFFFFNQFWDLNLGPCTC